MVSCALCAGGAAGATTLQRRADAAAVHWCCNLHSTFVHSGNDSQPLMSSNVHREYTGCAQVVLHQQGATERLQLRDETALQLLPKFCWLSPGLDVPSTYPRCTLDVPSTYPRCSTLDPRRYRRM